MDTEQNRSASFITSRWHISMNNIHIRTAEGVLSGMGLEKMDVDGSEWRIPGSDTVITVLHLVTGYTTQPHFYMKVHEASSYHPVYHLYCLIDGVRCIQRLIQEAIDPDIKRKIYAKS